MTNRGLSRMGIGFACSLAIAEIVTTAPEAHAGWHKITMIECDANYSQYFDIPSSGQSPYRWGYLSGSRLASHPDQNGGLGAGFYCPVPDTTSVPVWNINAVKISGFKLSNSHLKFKGCIQFTNGSGTACQTEQNAPDGDFTDWQFPFPANIWDEHWHSAYLYIFSSNSASFVTKVFYQSP